MRHTRRLTLLLAVAVAGTGFSGCNRRAAREAAEAAERALADSVRVQQEAAARQLAADSARTREAAMAQVRSVVAERIQFAYNQSTIRPAARAVLTTKAEALRANPGLRIRIAGHCDQRGSVAYNQALGLRRANATKQFLVRAGVDASRIEVVSHGKTRLLDSANNRQAWARNRRAEFEVLGAPPASL